jgi:outer membrane biogenesis lipoprotein LolB
MKMRFFLIPVVFLLLAAGCCHIFKHPPTGAAVSNSGTVSGK